jgi:hypothetical protein
LKSRNNQDSFNRISKTLAPSIHELSPQRNQRSAKKFNSGISLEQKVSRIKKNRDIYEEESVEQMTPPHKVSRFDQGDIAGLSVDDIIQSALMRREMQLHTRDDINEREYEPEPEPVPEPTPQRVHHQQANNNDMIERKVEEVLKRLIGDSQMSSIQGSRESSIPRNYNQNHSQSQNIPEYWNPQSHQYVMGQPQFNNSFGPSQSMFNSIPDNSQNNLLQLK